ncbi:hypothetical protein [Salinirubrum litoreum]|uniref:N-acetyltransferase n=1 Tax=Salinirubrum litoreum TaxID=1126234 RepID=A0ABD5RCH6_9EURY|nr:hypothetical protein [Salinirubrum litoreum]
MPGSPVLRTDRLILHPATTDDLDFLDPALHDPPRALLDTLGFREEGRPESEAYVDAEWTDSLRYGLLRDAWRGAE